MQSLHAKQEYRHALHCAYRILTEEGVFKFWKGTVPRLGRLIVSTSVPYGALRPGLIRPDERRHHLHRVRANISLLRQDRAMIRQHRLHFTPIITCMYALAAAMRTTCLFTLP